MFEGVPNFPKPDRFWEIVEKFGVNILYTAPTAVRSMMKDGDRWVNEHDISTLRLLGSVGEPITSKAWMWYYSTVGHGTVSYTHLDVYKRQVGAASENAINLQREPRREGQSGQPHYQYGRFLPRF